MRRVKISFKLLTLSGLAFCTLLAVGGAGYWGIAKLRDEVREVVDASNCAHAQSNADMMHDAIRGDGLAILLASGDDAIANAITEARAHSKNLKEYLAAVSQSLPDGDIRPALEKAMPDVEAYVAGVEEIGRLKQTDPEGAQKELPRFLGAFGRLEESLGHVSDLIQEHAAESVEHSNQAGRTATIMMMAILGGALALLAIASTLITRNIVRPVTTLSGLAQRLADCKFDEQVTIRNRDELGELGQNMNTVIANVGSAIGEILIAADQFAEVSGTVAQGADSLAQGAQVQSAGVDSISQNITELNAAIQKVTETTSSAAVAAEESAELGTRSSTKIAEGADAMERIHESAGKITEIVSLIGDIAFQTNLLALNAAIEAARAGDQGRGFAVVAEEVRKLAERCGQAAKQIATLVNEAIDRVKDGVKLSQESATAVSQIIASVQSTSKQMRNISESMTAQAGAAEKVSEAIHEITTTTEGAAAAAEQMSASSEELAAQAKEMRNIANRFALSPSATRASR